MSVTDWVSIVGGVIASAAILLGAVKWVLSTDSDNDKTRAETLGIDIGNLQNWSKSQDETIKAQGERLDVLQHHAGEQDAKIARLERRLKAWQQWGADLFARWDIYRDQPQPPPLPADD